MVRGTRRRAPLMPTRYNLAQGILFATTRFEPAVTRTDTGADFIGSILIDFDENGDYVAERRYKPYGELLAGTATTYGWTGNTGSRATLLQYAEQYNRRRHFSTKLKKWTTRDPLWPDESAYGYVDGGPLTWKDPSGKSAFNSSLSDFQKMACKPPKFPKGPVHCWRNVWSNFIYQFCRCAKKNRDRDALFQCDQIAQQYYRLCKGNFKGRPPFMTRDECGGIVAPGPIDVPKPIPSKKSGGGVRGQEDVRNPWTWPICVQNCMNKLLGEDLAECCRRKCKDPEENRLCYEYIYKSGMGSSMTI